MRKTQPRAGRSDWISQRTKDLMDRRDKVRDVAVKSSRREEWREYRELRNLCSLKVKQDINSRLKITFEKLQKGNDLRGLYRLAKNKMRWKIVGTPEAFLVNGNMVTSPKKMALLSWQG